MKGLSPTITSKSQLSGRSKSSCSFCRNPDHQATKCPHVPVIKKSLEQGIVPLEYMKSIAPNDHTGSTHWRTTSSYWTSPLSTYYVKGEAWGELFKQTDKAYEKWQKAQERAKTKVSRGKIVRNCGFCGGSSHTRRKCPEITRLTTQLKDANRNFRSHFYDNYVTKQGLSTGAIVDIEIAVSGSYNTQASIKKVRTIVTEINWDSINLFTTKEDAEVNWQTISPFHKSGGTGGQEKLDNIQEFIRSGVYLKVAKTTLEAKDVPSFSSYYDRHSDPYRAIPLPVFGFNGNNQLRTWSLLSKNYSSPTIESVTVVSRAPQALADDWIDGYSDEMAIIFKKFTRLQLEFLGVLGHIEEWATGNAANVE